MNWRAVSPGDVLRWAGVVFVVCLQVLVLVSIVLVLVEAL